MCRSRKSSSCTLSYQQCEVHEFLLLLWVPTICLLNVDIEHSPETKVSSAVTFSQLNTKMCSRQTIQDLRSIGFNRVAVLQFEFLIKRGV
ncbi:hypothetical protein NPIL_667781 [Nephila pilipes]|uniref:Uncharacterized protein n=1 Tax=Nephila pilipes TaxID=299642 RepID=A0A8X6NHN1_NEPPI|nr:hypothetical protein NPIL_667781 [Nephila pilipes]